MFNNRIAASAIIINDNKVLLNRCSLGPNGTSFLLGPGGGIEIEENLIHGLIREVREETGLNINVQKMLLVEDLLSNKYRMLKFWFLCDFIGGELIKTEEAEIEGIIDVNWYSREQLVHEIVYPEILKEIAWEEFLKKTWQTKYLDLKKADF
ncbi:MAG: NUDIX hydrolase [Candidatus Babeliales bacterium]